jgi:L-alanine-DL-glutamate epimerase-like enolase superfamily enzyme
VQGIVRMAMAGLDVAAWDALAIGSGVPLARLLGAELKPIPAYNSCGLGLMDDPEAVAGEAEKLLAPGFRVFSLEFQSTRICGRLCNIWRHCLRCHLGCVSSASPYVGAI